MLLAYVKRLLHFSFKVVFATVLVSSTLVWNMAVFLFVIGVIIAAFSSKTKGTGITSDFIYGNEEAKNTFISIPINGVIMGDESDVGEPLGLLSQSMTFGYSVKKELREIADDSSVKGVILDINSPGGTIYGANAIADGVAYYRQKTHKPVIAFVSGMAASGAYWSAVSADTIIADVGTDIGSIGVISGPFQYYDTVLAQDGGLLAGGVVTQKGIDTIYITAGRSKDFGNPYRKLTKDEIDSMQKMVNNEYDTFVSFVSTRRSIAKETIVSDLGAMLYDGKSALEKKMIDKVGSRDDAYEFLAQKTGIKADDFGVYQQSSKKNLVESLLSSSLLSHTVQPKASLCGLTKLHLAYAGNVEELCQ